MRTSSAWQETFQDFQSTIGPALVHSDEYNDIEIAIAARLQILAAWGEDEWMKEQGDEELVAIGKILAKTRIFLASTRGSLRKDSVDAILNMLGKLASELFELTQSMDEDWKHTLPLLNHLQPILSDIQDQNLKLNIMDAIGERQAMQSVGALKQHIQNIVNGDSGTELRMEAVAGMVSHIKFLEIPDDVQQQCVTTLSF